MVRCIDNIRYQQRQRLKQPVTQLEDPDQLKRKRKTTICTYPDSNEMITAQSLVCFWLFFAIFCFVSILFF